MDSTRPIRALTRGLDALTALNLRNGATVSEVAQEIRLPRTTVYRILETLCDAGFAFRDEADERYRLSESVKSLSDGFKDESWVREIAAPVIQDLCREVVWPIAISTLSGTSMMVRATTDHLSPLAMERYSPGFTYSVLISASGRLHLAYCSDAERAALLDSLARSGKPEAKMALNSAEIQRIVAQIKSQGYASAATTRRISDDLSLAVPVSLDGRMLAALSIRIAAMAMPAQTAVERFLPQLRNSAQRIATRVAQQRMLPAAAAV